MHRKSRNKHTLRMQAEAMAEWHIHRRACTSQDVKSYDEDDDGAEEKERKKTEVNNAALKSLSTLIHLNILYITPIIFVQAVAPRN